MAPAKTRQVAPRVTYPIFSLREVNENESSTSEELAFVIHVLCCFNVLHCVLVFKVFATCVVASAECCLMFFNCCLMVFIVVNRMFKSRFAKWFENMSLFQCCLCV